MQQSAIYSGLYQPLRHALNDPNGHVSYATLTAGKTIRGELAGSGRSDQSRGEKTAEAEENAALYQELSERSSLTASKQDVDQGRLYQSLTNSVQQEKVSRDFGRNVYWVTAGVAERN